VKVRVVRVSRRDLHDVGPGRRLRVHNRARRHANRPLRQQVRDGLLRVLPVARGVRRARHHRDLSRDACGHLHKLRARGLSNDHEFRLGTTRARASLCVVRTGRRSAHLAVGLLRGRERDGPAADSGAVHRQRLLNERVAAAPADPRVVRVVRLQQTTDCQAWCARAAHLGRATASAPQTSRLPPCHLALSGHVPG
jgi:hypothetical protein